MSEPRATLLVRVSASLKARLTEMAKRERRSLSKQVELLLERYIAALEKEGSAESRQKARSRNE
jgi:predicted HicB family RNase H-like nuclease